MKLTFLPFLRTNRQVYGGRPLTGNLSNVILSLRRILRYQPTTWDPSLCLLRVTPPLRCLDDGLVAIFLFQQLLVVLVVFEVFEARRRAVDHANTGHAFEQSAAKGYGLAIFQE